MSADSLYNPYKCYGPQTPLKINNSTIRPSNLINILWLNLNRITFSIFLDDFLETDLRPIYCSLTCSHTPTFFLGNNMPFSDTRVIFHHRMASFKDACTLTTKIWPFLKWTISWRESWKCIPFHRQTSSSIHSLYCGP